LSASARRFGGEPTCTAIQAQTPSSGNLLLAGSSQTDCTRPRTADTPGMIPKSLGAKAGAIERRISGMPRPTRAEFSQVDCIHRRLQTPADSARVSFASRGSGVQIPSAPRRSRGQLRSCNWPFCCPVQHRSPYAVAFPRVASLRVDVENVADSYASSLRCYAECVFSAEMGRSSTWACADAAGAPE